MSTLGTLEIVGPLSPCSQMVLVRGQVIGAKVKLSVGALSVGGGTASLQQQLIFRPVPGLARAETPVDGVYLASASAHPGGGVHGAPGANAARAALGRSSWTGGMRRRALDAVQRRIYR